MLALGLEPVSYECLFDHCTATIALLNGARISRGDRVAVVLPNGPEMAALFFAVTMGASCAPLNPTYRRSEFEFYLSDLAPRALIVLDGADPPAIEVAEARRRKGCSPPSSVVRPTAPTPCSGFKSVPSKKVTHQ